MYVASIHSGYGSMAEAVDPIVAFLVDEEQEALALAGKLQNLCNSLGHTELWSTYYPLDAEDQTTEPDELLRIAEAALRVRFD